MTDDTSQGTSEDPWGDSPSTVPPVVNDATTTRGESRRRIRLAAGGMATLVAVGGVAYAQTTHAATAATAATTSTSSTSTSGASSGVSVSSGSGGAAQATSAGS